MADFSTPFASTAARRSPSIDEKANGFPCGPADQTLFNGLFHRLEAEIGNVIAFAGLTGSDADLAQLRKAIEAMIDTATGGGDTSTYLLTSQAIARLPIFPEVLTADGRINISAPSTGIVRVPGGVDFVYRGVGAVTTSQVDMVTVSNKTYHLRWNKVDGFNLKDLSNGVYNPSTLAETDVFFDSTYDDMLVARIVTNSSNIATITNLMNKDRIIFEHDSVGAMTSNSGANIAMRNLTFAWNYARTPKLIGAPYLINADDGDQDYQFQMPGTYTRYGMNSILLADFATDFSARVLVVI